MRLREGGGDRARPARVAWRYQKSHAAAADRAAMRTLSVDDEDWPGSVGARERSARSDDRAARRGVDRRLEREEREDGEENEQSTQWRSPYGRGDGVRPRGVVGGPLGVFRGDDAGVLLV